MIMKTLSQNRLPGKMKLRPLLPNENSVVAPKVSLSVKPDITFSAMFLSSPLSFRFCGSVVECVSIAKMNLFSLQRFGSRLK